MKLDMLQSITREASGVFPINFGLEVSSFDDSELMLEFSTSVTELSGAEHIDKAAQNLFVTGLEIVKVNLFDGLQVHLIRNDDV